MHHQGESTLSNQCLSKIVKVSTNIINVLEEYIIKWKLSSPRKNIFKNETLARDGILFFEIFLLLFFPVIFDKYTLRIMGEKNVNANLHKE